MAVDISKFIPAAQRTQKETGIPASIVLGQIILESGGKNPGGLSGLAYNHKNLFGIKGVGTAGSIYLPTQEFRAGRMVTTTGKFRKYNSYDDAILDHGKLLTNERYSKHLTTATTVNDYAAGIKAGGYATDPAYTSKLLKVIESNELNQYDLDNMQFIPGGGAVGGSPATSIFAGATRFILLMLALILGVILFMKAFPATNNLMKTVAPGGKIDLVKKVLT